MTHLYTLSDQPHPYTRRTRGTTSCDAPCTHCLINPTPTPGEQEEQQVVTHPVHIVWSTPPLHQGNKRNNKLWRTLYTLSDQPHPFTRRTRGSTSCDAPCTHCLINPTPRPGEPEEAQVVTHPVHIVWSTPPLHQENQRKHKLWRTLYTLSDQPHPYTRRTRGTTSCDAPCTHCLINPTPTPGELEEQQVVTHPVHIVWSRETMSSVPSYSSLSSRPSRRSSHQVVSQSEQGTGHSRRAIITKSTAWNI